MNSLQDYIRSRNKFVIFYVEILEICSENVTLRIINSFYITFPSIYYIEMKRPGRPSGGSWIILILSLTNYRIHIRRNVYKMKIPEGHQNFEQNCFQ